MSGSLPAHKLHSTSVELVCSYLRKSVLRIPSPEIQSPRVDSYVLLLCQGQCSEHCLPHALRKHGVAEREGSSDAEPPTSHMSRTVDNATNEVETVHLHTVVTYPSRYAINPPCFQGPEKKCHRHPITGRDHPEPQFKGRQKNSMRVCAKVAEVAPYFNLAGGTAVRGKVRSDVSICILPAVPSGLRICFALPCDQL